MSVVLPAPFGPSRAMTSPRFADSVTPTRASVEPKRLVTALTSTITDAMPTPDSQSPVHGEFRLAITQSEEPPDRSRSASSRRSQRVAIGLFVVMERETPAMRLLGLRHVC